LSEGIQKRALTWNRHGIGDHLHGAVDQNLSLSGLVRDEEANPSRALLAAEGDDYVSVKE